MKVNYHTYTCRCKHAGGTEEDYVLAAIKNDIKILGFSDHAPFPGNENYGLRMEYSELDDYLNELDVNLSYKTLADLQLTPLENIFQ